MSVILKKESGRGFTLMDVKLKKRVVMVLCMLKRVVMVICMLNKNRESGHGLCM